MFVLESSLLGLGLAMDASAVSMANGFAEPKMKKVKIILIAVMFGLFQGVMPLLGYFIGLSVVEYIEKWIPWIALIILCILGGRMIYGALKNKEDESEEIKSVGVRLIYIQAIATSIDALSVGLTIANYTITKAVICASIIAGVTFICSLVSVFLGKKFGTKLGKKAELIGGIILILIGLKIFITGLFF